MVKIEIPKEIYEDIERRLEEATDFRSVEDYVAFVLGEVLKEEEENMEERITKNLGLGVT